MSLKVLLMWSPGQGVLRVSEVPPNLHVYTRVRFVIEEIPDLFHDIHGSPLGS